MHLVLIADAKRQRPAPALAEYLFRPALFELSKLWAKCHGDDWAILSANTGVARPDTMLSPYNVRLERLSPDEVDRWGRLTADMIRSGWQQADRITILAPADYCDALRDAGLKFEAPFAGMRGVSEWCAWLRETVVPDDMDTADEPGDDDYRPEILRGAIQFQPDAPADQAADAVQRTVARRGARKGRPARTGKAFPAAD